MSRSKESQFRPVIVSTFSSQGNRPIQEDFLLMDRDRGVFVVADGFGGAKAGIGAAQVACESVRNFLFKEARDLDATLPFILRKYFSLAGNVLFNALIFANRKVNALNRGKNVHERGGTSVLAGFLDGNLLALAQVGVCSAWLIRKDEGVQLVVPRSYGLLKDPFSALKCRLSPAVWQAPLVALGMAEDLEPEIFEYQLKAGDWLTFQSDGIPNDFMETLIQVKGKKLGPEQSVSELTQVLKQRSFEDNATISLMIF